MNRDAPAQWATRSTTFQGSTRTLVRDARAQAHVAIRELRREQYGATVRDVGAGQARRVTRGAQTPRAR